MSDRDKTDIIRKQILDKASEYFFDYGYANTTTGQIAGDLGISKKTLYKYYPRKEDLLSAVVERMQGDFERKFREILENPQHSFVEKTNELAQSYGAYTARIPMHFYRDVEKLRPGWKREYQELPYVEAFFAEGIQQGLIRKDISLRMMMIFMKVSMNAMISYASAHADDLTVQEVLETVPRLFGEGFLSEQGRVQLRRG